MCVRKIRPENWEDFIQKCFEDPEKFIKVNKKDDSRKKRGFQNKLAEITKT